MSSLTISQTTLHASAVVMTLEMKVELSTRTEKDEMHTTISLITLHAGAIETTIESGFQLHMVAKSKLVESVLGSVGSDI